MPVLNGLEAAQEIVQSVSRTKIVMLAVHDSDAMIRKVLAVGVRGYVFITDVARDLVSAVKDVLRYHQRGVVHIQAAHAYGRLWSISQCCTGSRRVRPEVVARRQLHPSGSGPRSGPECLALTAEAVCRGVSSPPFPRDSVGDLSAGKLGSDSL